MTSRRSYDAIVIGGGTSGLVAAAYLGKAGKNILLLEAQDMFGGRCARTNLGEGFCTASGAQTLYALDPLVARELKLARKGLRFEGRELALTGLRNDGKHIVIRRDAHDTASSIAVHSQQDAEAWPRFRKELFDLARAMRPLWWENHGTLPSGAARQKLDRIARMGAIAWLDSWFESEALKATLCFDATDGGLSVLEPGSALALVWRAAQEISGLQGASAIPQGGLTSLTDALVLAATEAGCELRTGARAESLILDQGKIAGVQIQSGETCFAPLVFSAIPRGQLFFKLLSSHAVGIAHRSTAARQKSALAEASILIALRGAPSFVGVAVPAVSRFVLADRPEIYALAEMSARAGKLGDELPITFVIPTFSDPSLAPPGQHLLSAQVRLVPGHPVGGWTALKKDLAVRIAGAMEKLAPGLSRVISSVEIISSHDVDDGLPITVPHMLSSAAQRVETQIDGLFLCGADAEPVPAISGRAARVATALATAGQR